MSLQIGDRVVVKLGDMRNQYYQSPSGGSTTLNGLLPDGTTSIITSINTEYPDWCYLVKQDLYYPMEFLFLAKTTRQKLHEAVRGIR